ncbi:MAG: hypothetical protein RLZZ237_1023 [Pseudomonadota bacterium]
MHTRFTHWAVAAAMLALTGCTTVTPNNIREVNEQNVKSCRFLGNVNGSDAIFIGLSSSIGSKNAKAKALNQGVNLKASDVVWSQQGTSTTNEWIGKAYACR